MPTKHGKHNCLKTQVESNKIKYKCPSCNQETITVDASGFLVCSLIGCKEPGLIHDKIQGEVLIDNDTVVRQENIIKKLQEEISVLRRTLDPEDTSFVKMTLENIAEIKFLQAKLEEKEKEILGIKAWERANGIDQLRKRIARYQSVLEDIAKGPLQVPVFETYATSRAKWALSQALEGEGEGK